MPSCLLVLALAALTAVSQTSEAVEIYATDWYGGFSVITDDGGFTSTVHHDPGIFTPHGVEVGADGDLYIASSSNIGIYETDGTPVADPGTSMFTDINNGALAFDVAGNTYVTDRFTRSITKYAPDGTALYGFNMPEITTGIYQGTFDLAVDNEGYL